ncbi:MAG: dTDP-4-dehydrorhamnose 3,5-epimerase [Nanoarchaeota archaeon]|nr:dTDP-4-dehydrorhamnose 3,5-epimerase [Nanoarchaeota archaeon]
MLNMKIKKLETKGVFEIIPEPHEDARGFFMRTYDEDIFKKQGISRQWVQENHSFSKQKGVVRGLHFQFPPHAETKLVRVVTGEIFVAIVDLRKGDGLGKWTSTILSAKNKKMLFAPRGVAMGICTLSEDCTLLYKMDNRYTPESQGAIKWDDPDIGIEWPVKNPMISDRDKNAISFKKFVEKHGGFSD